MRSKSWKKAKTGRPKCLRRVPWISEDQSLGKDPRQGGDQKLGRAHI